MQCTYITPDKEHFFNRKVLLFSYFSMKTYVVGIHQKRLGEALLMTTHNICFLGEIRKKYLDTRSYPNTCTGHKTGPISERLHLHHVDFSQVVDFFFFFFFFAISAKEDNFCDSLFAFLSKNPLLKNKKSLLY